MGILALLVLGLLAGLVAKLILPGNDPGGLIVTMVIGVVGAFVGGLLASALGFGGLSGFDFRTFVIAVIGSIILLLIWRAVKRPRYGGRRRTYTRRRRWI
ncbi:MAG TPA: GlsB/YeaQ/YmgE family stress response membrane protein [Actinomycetes bacterium]